MAVELEHRFGRESRVRDYWLAASEGFTVQSSDGRPLGTVRQVVHERDGRAVALLVEARRGLVGTDEVVLEAEAVEEVAPWRSTLVVPLEEVPVPEPAVEWPAVRHAVTARVGAAGRRYAVGVQRDASFLATHWPSVQTRLLQAWAWAVAVVVALAGAGAAQARTLAARLAAALSASRSH
jgi:hypothetical protein